MKPKQRILTALSLGTPDRVPFTDWIDPGIRRKLTTTLGYDELDDVQFHQEMGMDAICYCEAKYLSPAFCKMVYDDGVAHLQGEGLIKSAKDLDRFILPDLDEPGYFDHAKRYIDRYGKSDLAIYGSLRTGMMNTIFSMGLVDFSYALFDNVNFIEHLLDSYIEWNIRVADEMTKAGFDFLVAYDDIAFNSGPIMMPDAFRDIFLPRMKTFASTLKLPWAYHTDGDAARIFDDLVSMGMNAFNPFQPDVMDIFEYKDKYGDKLCLWGNIDLTYTLTRGTIAEVEAEVEEKLTRLSPGGGYIMATSNSITDYCIPENIMAMMREKENFNNSLVHASALNPLK